MFTVEELSYKHPEWSFYKTTWDTITDIREGATGMMKNILRYCPQRPGEEPEVYRARLSKFSYTPVMTSAIRKFVAKLTNSPITASNTSDFWEDFRSNVSGSKLLSDRTSENDLITNIFSSVLYYGRVYLAVDRPKLGKAFRSIAEQSQYNTSPYVKLIEAPYVINWTDNGESITYEEYPRIVIGKAPQVVRRWVVYTSESVDVYESLKDSTDLTLVSSWSHGLGYSPIVKLVLPLEMWVGNNTYLKQLQHTLIESGWTDSGSLAGVIQRVYTPLDPPPQDDVRYSYEQPDYQELKTTGNAHILIGKGYQIVESSGAAVNNLTSQLEVIETQIKELVDLSFASSKKGVLEQSGKSKEVDMTLLNASMESYGSKVLKLYQDVCNIVADLAKVEPIQLHGLNTYSSNNLSLLLEQTGQLQGLPIPSKVLYLWFSKLSNQMLGKLPPELEQEVKEELEKMLDSGVYTVYDVASESTNQVDQLGIEPTEENTQVLADMFGISPEEAISILNETE